MKKNIFALLGVVLLVAACSSPTTLKAPCPNYGANCMKQPINDWNYRSV